MNTQDFKNKRIISFIYRILSIILGILGVGIFLSLSFFALSYFNPGIEPFYPILDIPLNINLPGILELKDGSMHKVIIDDAFISFNLNKTYGIPGVINFLHFLAILSIAFYITYLLWKIFGSIRDSLIQENPFQSENTKRIRLIALAMFFSAILDILYPIILKYFWFNTITINESAFDFRLRFDAAIDFLWILIVLVVAEIYRIGSEIKKEQELTI